MRRILTGLLPGLILMFTLTVESKAQYEKKDEKPGIMDRIFFGGNFGFTFGNTTSIIISPLMGYHLTPKLALGGGLRYEYFKSNYPGYVPFDTHIFGGSVFSRYMIIKNLSETIGVGGLNSGIFIQAEYEMLSLESKYYDIANRASEGRFNLHSILVGGGIFQPIGRRGGFLLSVLWNLNESYNSIYANPIIRVGFNF